MLATGTAISLAATLAACGNAAPTRSSRQDVVVTCQTVSAVLRDGPDRAVDPVGYAVAQVGPLRQIHPADRKLRSALDRLASAYPQVSNSDASKAADQVAAKAADTVDQLCPGAVP